MQKEQMNIVIVGHVDHGKSTVIGRLLADTNTLPEGKLEQVKQMCTKNSKPFEYAFLLDALKDEQAQGITIDSARCFFKTAKRDYIIIDAPGHIEFLKNMVSGAARAEAALLVIDALEGIRENSKRHGYLVSMLGIKQVVILVNKMDLIDYDQEKFQNIVTDYTAFLKELSVEPISFIPVSAREGDNIIQLSDKMPWYNHHTVLEQVDAFEKKTNKTKLPFRFPVQDIYKFTNQDDDRRIFAGTVLTGSIKEKEKILFLPSYKESTITGIESFNTAKKTTASAGEALGFTLETQIYIKPGEIMVKANDTSIKVSSRFKANIFWMNHAPLIKGKTYKLKLASTKATATLVDIISVIDASELNSEYNKKQIDRHDVAEIILETTKPIAFDPITQIEDTGRFVMVDNYEIAGGGIILESLSSGESTLKEHIQAREYAWDKGLINAEKRANNYQHQAKFIVFTGTADSGQRTIAKKLEEKLFNQQYKVYYLGINNIEKGLDADLSQKTIDRDEAVRRLGELARIMTDSGQIFITATDDLDDYDIEKLKLLNKPNEILIINIGKNHFTQFTPDLTIEATEEIEAAVSLIEKMLHKKQIMMEYYI